MNIDHVPALTRRQLQKVADLPIAEQAKRLGLALNTVRAYRSAMIRAGMLLPKARSATAADISRVRRLAGEGLSVPGIAERAGISHQQVYQLLREHGITRAHERWGAKEIAALFVVSLSTVQGWRDAGWLALTPARGDEYVKGIAQRAGRAEVRRFLHVREAWPSYAPTLISDDELRALAEQTRRIARGRWLSLANIGAAENLSADAVAKRTRLGWLAELPQTTHGRARFYWLLDGQHLPEFTERNPWDTRRRIANAAD